jgi:uncharacterized protein (DUF2384 family)
MASPRRRKGVSPVYAELARATPLERIEMIRRGLPPIWIMDLAFDLRLSADNLMVYLGLCRASVEQALLAEARLSRTESDPVMALLVMVGEALLDGDTADTVPPDEQAIVAARLGKWLRTPMTALGRRAPLQFVDTACGRAMVAALLALSFAAHSRKNRKCTFSADT